MHKGKPSLRFLFFLLMAPAILCLFILQTPAVAQIPPGSDLEKLRSAWLAAKKIEAEAKQNTRKSRDAERQIAAKMLDQLSKNQAAYDAVKREYDDLRRERLKKLEERAAASIKPASLMDMYAEYKRRYDILKDYRQYVDDAFWKKITDRTADLHKQIESAKADSEKKIAGIDRELAKLEERRKPLDQRFEKVLALPSDPALFGQWLKALAEAGKSEQACLDAESTMAEAFRKYAEALQKTSPPFLQSLAVSADGKEFYRAEWVPTDPSGSSQQNQNLRDEETAALREANAQFEKNIQEMSEHLKSSAQDRMQTAISMLYLGERMSAAARELTLYKQARITGNAIAEALGTIVEVVLTSGAATVARKGAELAESSAQKALKAAEIESAREGASGLLHGEMSIIKSGFEHEKKHIYLTTTEEWAFAQGILPDIKKEFSERQLKLFHLQSAEQKAIENIQKSEWKQRLGYNAWYPERLSYHGVGKPSEAIGVKAAAIKYMVNHPTKEDRELDAFLAKDEWFSLIVVSDLMEEGFNRGTTGAILQGQETLDWIKARSGTGIKGVPGTRWQKFQASLSFKNFKEAFKPNPSLLISAVTTGVKSAITAYLGTQEDKALKRWIDAEVEFKVKYQVYYDSLMIDKGIWDLQQNYRVQLAQNMGRLAELRKPRELKIATNEMMPGLNGSVQIQTRFSTFLSKSAVVTIGGVPVEMKPLGPPDSSDRWESSIEAIKIPLTSSTAQFEISISESNRPFAKLDSNPGTPASLEKPSDESWKNYEAGSDSNHKIICLNLTGKWKATGYEKGPEEVDIRHAGKQIAATKIQGSTFIGKGQTTWECAIEDSLPIRGKVQVAKPGSRDPKWLNAVITIKDKDHLLVEDDLGWTAELIRIRK